MAVDLTFLLAPLDRLLAYSQRERHYLAKRSDEHVARRKDALHAIFEALHATRKYQELGSTSPNRDDEYELSRLWGVASIKSEGMFDLHDDAADKSRYWASMLRWPVDVVVAKGIDLAAIEQKYRELLDDERK